MHQKWDARAYAKFSTGQEKWAKELIEKLQIKGHEDILDIGCGDGKVTSRLANSTDGNVVGIDKSDTMIELAKKRYPNITFIQMDATKLTFKESFDIIFSNAVLHWVFDHAAVLGGIKRALRPEGRALLQFGGEGNARQIIETMEQFIQNSDYACYFKNFTFPYYFPEKERYNQLLHEAGFSDFRVSLIPKEMLHDNREAFKGWIRTTWFPYTARLPEALQEKFIEEFTDAYLKSVPPKGEKISVQMVRLEVALSSPLSDTFRILHQTVPHT